MSFSCNRVFWGFDFQVILCSPNSMVLTEFYVRMHEQLHGNNDKCLRKPRKSLFIRMRFIMQLSFLRLWFPIALVFSVLYHCDRSLCFNARAVAQKQWQMLENWRSHGFLKMRFVMQMSFLGLCFSSIIVFSETHDCIRRLCFNARAAVRNEREVLEEHQFFSKCVYQITEFSEVVIFNLSCVLRIQWIKQNYMFERTSGCTETMASA